MEEILYGLIVVIIVVILVDMYKNFKQYKVSIYPFIYSNFLEFYVRKTSQKKLSTSSWLKTQFGHHRILYQIVNDDFNNHSLLLLLITEKGVEIIYCLHINGSIKFTKNRTVLMQIKKNKYQNLGIIQLENTLLRINKQTRNSKSKGYIAFPTNTSVCNESEINIYTYETVIAKIIACYQERDSVFTESQIEEMYKSLSSM